MGSEKSMPQPDAALLSLAAEYIEAVGDRMVEESGGGWPTLLAEAHEIVCGVAARWPAANAASSDHAARHARGTHCAI